jgi:hypothetical protein
MSDAKDLSTKIENELKPRSMWDISNVVKWSGLFLLTFVIQQFVFPELTIYEFGTNIVYIILVSCFIAIVINFVYKEIQRDSESSIFKRLPSVIKELSKDNKYCTSYIACKLSIAFMSIFSGITTAYGFSFFLINDISGNSKFVGFILPVIIAAAISLGIYSFWTLMMNQVMSEDSSKSKKLKALLLYPAFFAIFIFGASTMTSVLGMAGKESIKQHYLVSLGEYKRSLEEIAVYRTQEVSTINLIKRYISKYEKEYEEEVNGNGRTSVKGKGAVANALNDTKNEFKDAKVLLESSSHNFNLKYELVNMNLNQMTEDLMKLNMSVYEMERTMEEGMAIVHQDMLSMINSTPVPVLKSLTSFLNFTKGSFRAKSSDQSTANKQQEALDYFTQLANLTADEINSEIKPLEVRKIPELPIASRINANKSIFIYYKEIINYWVIAIVIDFWAWFILFLQFEYGRNLMISDSFRKKEKFEDIKVNC